MGICPVGICPVGICPGVFVLESIHCALVISFCDHIGNICKFNSFKHR